MEKNNGCKNCPIWMENLRLRTLLLKYYGRMIETKEELEEWMDKDFENKQWENNEDGKEKR